MNAMVKIGLMLVLAVIYSSVGGTLLPVGSVIDVLFLVGAALFLFGDRR